MALWDKPGQMIPGSVLLTEVSKAQQLRVLWRNLIQSDHMPEDIVLKKFAKTIAQTKLH